MPAALPRLREAYLGAIVAGERRRAFAIVEEARASGLDVAVLYVEVLQPSLREIGRLWQESAVTVAEEHLATAITQMVMAHIYAEQVTIGVTGDRTLIAACAEAERHEVGLRMVCDLLEREGWEAIYLGASVPPEGLVPMIRERRPDAVALSVSIAPHLPALRTTVHGVRRAMGDMAPYILVGGRPFLDDPALARWVGADAMAYDAMEAVIRMRERFG